MTEERLLRRSAGGGPGGWFGLVVGRPLFRTSFSEAVIPLSATFGRLEAIKPLASRRSETLGMVAVDPTAVRVGEQDGLTS